MSTDNSNEPMTERTPLGLPSDWGIPPFEEGRTWQGPAEEWSVGTVFDDISPEELDATKAALRARLKADPALSLADPKLWRGLIQELGTNGATVGIAVFMVHEEGLLGSS